MFIELLGYFRIMQYLSLILEFMHLKPTIIMNKHNSSVLIKYYHRFPSYTIFFLQFDRFGLLKFCIFMNEKDTNQHFYRYFK